MSNALGLKSDWLYNLLKIDVFKKSYLEKVFIDFETVLHFSFSWLLPYIRRHKNTVLQSEFFTSVVNLKRITESADFLNNVLNITYAVIFYQVV